MKETSIQLLKNPDQEPTDKLFKELLDNPVYGFLKKVEQGFVEKGVDFEWRYYKDGKAWLGKAVYRKKTIVWISIWESFVKANFYFTEKTRSGIMELNLSPEITLVFSNAKPIGKLIPLTIDIKDEQALQDFNAVLNYKKSLG